MRSELCLILKNLLWYELGIDLKQEFKKGKAAPSMTILFSFVQRFGSSKQRVSILQGLSISL
jgi:hypothetical protein